MELMHPPLDGSLPRERVEDVPRPGVPGGRQEQLAEGGLADGAGEAESLTGLGTAAHAEGCRAQARDFFSQSLSLNRSFSNSSGEAVTLVTCAALAMAEGSPRSAVRVMAAGGSLLAALPPVRKRAIEETLSAARTALGEKDFTTAWAEGQEATPQEAVGRALTGE